MVSNWSLFKERESQGTILQAHRQRRHAQAYVETTMESAQGNLSPIGSEREVPPMGRCGFRESGLSQADKIEGHRPCSGFPISLSVAVRIPSSPSPPNGQRWVRSTTKWGSEFAARRCRKHPYFEVTSYFETSRYST